MKNLSEEEKKSTPEKVTITITLPTKEKIVETLTNLFPGVTVEVQGEKEEKPEEAEETEEGEATTEPE